MTDSYYQYYQEIEVTEYKTKLHGIQGNCKGSKPNQKDQAIATQSVHLMVKLPSSILGQIRSSDDARQRIEPTTIGFEVPVLSTRTLDPELKADSSHGPYSVCGSDQIASVSVQFCLVFRNRYSCVVLVICICHSPFFPTFVILFSLHVQLVSIC